MNTAELDRIVAERARRFASRTQDELDAYRAECDRLSLPHLAPAGLPLRPLLLTQTEAHGLTRGLKQLRSTLAALQPTNVTSHASVSELAHWRDHLAASHFFSVMRPDLRRGPDCFSVIDLNIGTPTAVTAFETDLLNRLYRRLFHVWGLEDLEAALGFGANCAAMQAQAMRRMLPGATRLLAILPPSLHPDAHEFDGQMAGFLEELEQELGVEVLLVDPSEAEQLAADPGALLYQLGTADMAVAAVAATLAPILALPHIGDRWFTSPFSSHYEKHLLPRLSGRYGEFVDVPEAWALERSTVERAIAERELSVMKHGRNLKRVLVGARTPPEMWRDGARLAAHAPGYIVQRAVVQTPQRVPVWLDGRVEFIEVVEELSPFLVDDSICACFVRYLPTTSSSDVVSPPPKDLGLSVARVLPDA